MSTVEINASKEYNVIIEKGALSKVGDLAKDLVGKCRGVIITDDKVDTLYSGTLTASLESSGFSVIKFAFENGEKSKNFETYKRIIEFLAENRIGRKDVIFALGGGVVGDIAGFCAATYLRGIRFIQVPTTLLAAVDSSVGGKTGIDLDFGKNLVGAFYQPELVVCDPDTLGTLDKNIFADGCAEVIKYGAISDGIIFEMMSTPENLDTEAIIRRCVEAKRDVVVKDEFESGLRQILNFGHTFGHAVEKCSNYKIPHGSAVAVGMSIIMRATAKKEYADKLLSLLEKYNLPTKTDFGADELFESVLSDKKRSADKITLVLPVKEGECKLCDKSLCEVREILAKGL